MINCTINGQEFNLKEISQLGWNEFCRKSVFSFPLKLYKYFPNTDSAINIDGEQSNVNFSQQALRNNTVYMNNPKMFDDPFDAELFIDSRKFMELRLKYYLDRANIKYSDDSTLEDITYILSTELYNLVIPITTAQDIIQKLLVFFNVSNDQTAVELRTENFIRSVVLNLSENIEWYDIIWNSIHEEYKRFITPKRLRIASFTTSPFLIRMWSTYADFHKGFCIEYDCSNYDPHDDLKVKCFHNTLPVIYTDAIQDLSSEQHQYLSSNEFSLDDLWTMYFYGALRKSTVWKDQQEWRYVLQDEASGADLDNINTGFVAPYFKISKVYLGNKMDKTNRLKIAGICNEIQIPYTCVTPSRNFYEMDVCQKMANCDLFK